MSSRKVSEDGKVQCDRCQEWFARSFIAKHKQSAHMGHKFACGDCGNQYAYHSGLSDHRKKKHSGLKSPSQKQEDDSTTQELQAQLEKVQLSIKQHKDKIGRLEKYLEKLECPK